MIDAMSLAEAGQIFDYWAASPPVHLMVQTVARMLGWKPAPAAAALADVVAAVPPGVRMAPAGDLGMPTPVLDIELLRERNIARLANRPDGM